MLLTAATTMGTKNAAIGFLAGQLVRLVNTLSLSQHMSTAMQLIWPQSYCGQLAECYERYSYL